MKPFLPKKYGTIFYFFLGFVFFWGIFLRLYALPNASLWMDEGYSYLAAKTLLETGGITLETGFVYGEHSVVFHTLQAFSLFLFGENEWGLRFPSFLFGIFTFVGSFFALRFLLKPPLTPPYQGENSSPDKGRSGGVIKIALPFLFSAFLTLSSWEITWSMQGRMYMVLQFFFLLTLFFLWLFFQEPWKGKKMWYFSGYLLSALLASYTHPFGLITFVYFFIFFPFFTYSRVSSSSTSEEVFEKKNQGMKMKKEKQNKARSGIQDILRKWIPGVPLRSARRRESGNFEKIYLWIITSISLFFFLCWKWDFLMIFFTDIPFQLPYHLRYIWDHHFWVFFLGTMTPLFTLFFCRREFEFSPSNKRFLFFLFFSALLPILFIGIFVSSINYRYIFPIYPIFVLLALFFFFLPFWANIFSPKSKGESRIPYGLTASTLAWFQKILNWISFSFDYFKVIGFSFRRLLWSFIWGGLILFLFSSELTFFPQSHYSLESDRLEYQYSFETEGENSNSRLQNFFIDNRYRSYTPQPALREAFAFVSEKKTPDDLFLTSYPEISRFYQIEPDYVLPFDWEHRISWEDIARPKYVDIPHFSSVEEMHTVVNNNSGYILLDAYVWEKLPNDVFAYIETNTEQIHNFPSEKGDSSDSYILLFRF